MASDGDRGAPHLAVPGLLPRVAPAQAPAEKGQRRPRLLVTRASEQSSELRARLEAAGAEVVELPTIQILPVEDAVALDTALGRVHEYGWVVFTSPNGVRQALARPKARDAAWPRIAAVGQATASALAEARLCADFTPSAPTGRSLGAELPVGPGERVLLFRSDVARPELPAALRARGAVVDEVVAYRTTPRTEPAPDVAAELRAGRVDAILLASPSAVRGLVAAVGGDPELYRATSLIAIGPTTAAAIREMGLPLAATADDPSPRGLVAVLTREEGKR